MALLRLAALRARRRAAAQGRARDAASSGRRGTRSRRWSIEGRTIARTFWGKAWCDNLERYSDYANRLPRGRTYVRNGSVVDLQIAPGEVTAPSSAARALHGRGRRCRPCPRRAGRRSAGTARAGSTRWSSCCRGASRRASWSASASRRPACSPSPAEIEFSCSCPDWASMCKHVAAVLYGIGARLDEQPELLFRLRGRSTRRSSSPRPGKAPAREEGPGGRRRSSPTTACRSCSASTSPRRPRPPKARRRKLRPAKPARAKAPARRPKPRPAGGAGSRGARRR